MLSEKDAKELVSDLAASVHLIDTRHKLKLNHYMYHSWVDGLPEELKFEGPEKSSPEQGVCTTPPS